MKTEKVYGVKDMTEKTQDEIVAMNKYLAVELHNHAWGLYDKEDRTQAETEEMINASHASAFHWSQLSGHIDEIRWKQSFPRAHNQLANMYHSAGIAEAAIFHGKRCIETCEQFHIGDFDLAFGYECLAKGYELAGDTEKRNENLKLALGAADGIIKEEDKKFFLSELEKAPGFELIK